MKTNEDFMEWLSSNGKWSNDTIGKYEGVARNISAQMLKKGIINKPLGEMNKVELDRAIFLIMQDNDFMEKDKVGNRMYSNGLKQYRSFVASIQTSSEVDVAERDIESDIEKDSIIPETERKAIIAARIGQGLFRKQLIDKYGKCIITGVDNAKLLIASHIKPWSQSNNIERISANNGLLLTPTFDKLFDYGLITFNKNGKLLVSSFVGAQNEQRLNIPKNAIFDLRCNKEFLINMQYHNDVLFVK